MPVFTVNAQTITERLSGKILLSVQENGEAWYLNPDNMRRYYLGRPHDAFRIMRELSLGITNNDFDKIQNNVPSRFSGKILLKVEDNGRAYYINPDNMKMYYLGRPQDAFNVMRELGLGITKENLSQIKIYSQEEVVQRSIKYIVPFTSQAPKGEWSDPVYQDGCEEASALMAIYWAQGKDFRNLDVSQEILKMSNFEENLFGEFRDVSIEDTHEMIKKYFSYDNIELKEIKTVADIISSLEKGVLIAPANGKKLGNVNFTPPGPINHMLVITGYNPNNKTFITNDPGTRNGKDYVYNENILLNAIRNYPTGYHEPNPDEERTVIIVKK